MSGNDLTKAFATWFVQTYYKDFLSAFQKPKLKKLLNSLMEKAKRELCLGNVDDTDVDVSEINDLLKVDNKDNMVCITNEQFEACCSPIFQKLGQMLDVIQTRNIVEISNVCCSGGGVRIKPLEKWIKLHNLKHIYTSIDENCAMGGCELVHMMAEQKVILDENITQYFVKTNQVIPKGNAADSLSISCENMVVQELARVVDQKEEIHLDFESDKKVNALFMDWEKTIEEINNRICCLGKKVQSVKDKELVERVMKLMMKPRSLKMKEEVEMLEKEVETAEKNEMPVPDTIKPRTIPNRVPAPGFSILPPINVNPLPNNTPLTIKTPNVPANLNHNQKPAVSSLPASSPPLKPFKEDSVELMKEILKRVKRIEDLMSNPKKLLKISDIDNREIKDLEMGVEINNQENTSFSSLCWNTILLLASFIILSVLGYRPLQAIFFIVVLYAFPKDKNTLCRMHPFTRLKKND